MKRILFIFCLAAISQLIISCEDDDTIDNTNLIGTWKLTEINTQQAYDINYNGTSSINLLDEISELNEIGDFNCMTNETYTFGSNNMVTVTNTSDFDLEIFIYEGQETFDIDCDPVNDTENYTFSQNGNTIIIDYDETMPLTINGDKLSFVATEWLYVFDSETSTDTYQDATFVYTKQ